MKKPAVKKRPRTRTNDPDRTQQDIIAVATEEFSEHGLSGARVDNIAERTRTSKRMIYYYFKSKEGLYLEVLTNYYKTLRNAERNLNLDDLPPLEALTKLVHFTVDFHNAHADDVRLVIAENMQRGRFIKTLPSLEPINSVVINAVRRICERGAAAGVMRDGIDPIDLYMSIAALSFFNISNRYTFSIIFNHDMESAEALEKRKASITDTILRSVGR
ncbi:TetR/AcrR family transcriptional regulator [Caulobacter segnis]|jgi:AcrR family transcriptional regulator|uniref:TetR/AcrR family transcriptional regulator n=1 Tax=Caulobacter segnis TaxID=88688 RepID=UPI001CBFBA48|nr:TetR/AcrR family transcriptional regulator [Caulobacter segnis]UAL09508.1 TetR family transcriptional regulator [Caulobacter segnis]